MSADSVRGAGRAGSVDSVRRRFAAFVRDAGEWWLLPGLAALLPWPLCFRLYAGLCVRLPLFEEKTRAALAQLEPPLAGDAARRWAARFRLVQLVDRADTFLARSRGDRWLDRHVRRQGDDWPTLPFIALSFHYGAGLWCLRDIARGGRRAAFLSIRFERFFGGAWLRYRGACLRIREVERAGRAPVIYTGGGRQAVREALEAGTAVVGLIDVPAVLSKRVIEQPFLGATAWFPPGLIALASELRVPLVAYAMGFDPVSGKRELVVRRIAEGEPAARLAEVVGFLEQEIGRNPPAWHNWPELRAFRTPPASGQT